MITITEKFEIKNRWTDRVQFVAEIECAPDAPKSWKARLAVLWGIKNGSNLSDCDLRGSNLSDCDLRGSNLSDCDLRGSDLSDCDLSDCDLRGSNLSDCDLRGSDLRLSDLRDCDLRGSDLRYCDLSWSDLSDCDMRCSNLSWSDLSDCDLSWSDLSDCDMRFSNLSWSDLSDCDLSDCDMRWSNLSDCDLSGAKIDFEIATTEQAAPRIAAVAKAALANEDALNMRVWHTCETTHCMAGWAIHLAGEQGKALEGEFGSYVAGLSLLGTEAASHFYDNKVNATAWLRGKLEVEV